MQSHHLNMMHPRPWVGQCEFMVLEEALNKYRRVCNAIRDAHQRRWETTQMLKQCDTFLMEEKHDRYSNVILHTIIARHRKRRRTFSATSNHVIFKITQKFISSKFISRFPTYASIRYVVVPCTMPPSQNRKYLLTHMLLLTNISTNYSVRNNHIHTHYDYRSSIIIPGIYRC